MSTCTGLETRIRSHWIDTASFLKAEIGSILLGCDPICCRNAGERRPKGQQTCSDVFGGTDLPAPSGRSSSSRKKGDISIHQRTGRSPTEKPLASSHFPTTSRLKEAGHRLPGRSETRFLLA